MAIEDIKDLLSRAFITCVSGDGRPYVKVQFQELRDAQEFHSFLVGCTAPEFKSEAEVQNGNKTQ